MGHRKHASDDFSFCHKTFNSSLSLSVKGPDSLAYHFGPCINCSSGSYADLFFPISHMCSILQAVGAPEFPFKKDWEGVFWLEGGTAGQLSCSCLSKQEHPTLALLFSFLHLLLGICCSLYKERSLHVSVFRHLTQTTLLPDHVPKKTSPSSKYRIFCSNFLKKLTPVHLALIGGCVFFPSRIRMARRASR